MTTSDFILQYRTSDVAKAALLVRQYKDVDHEFALRQIEGWQKACTKLPEISRIDGWYYPVRLSMEQCSSEQTAKYKAKISLALSEAIWGKGTAKPGDRGFTLIDLTGGFGIDAYYMGTTDYVEQNAELCQIVAHNMSLAGRPTRIHNTTAEAYLNGDSQLNVPTAQINGEATKRAAKLIYLDPARRDNHGGKVFRLEDCTPNVVELYPTLMSHCDVLMLKLSPMLDITEALRRLPDAREVHVVAVKNEVKEVLIICHTHADTLSYTCVNLDTPDPIFQINSAALNSETLNSVALNGVSQLNSEALNVPQAQLNYLYEPNAAIMKAGLYNEVCHQYNLTMLAENSHLYTSDTLLESFPGRIWTVHEATKEELKSLTQANILTRNYPLRPEEIKKKYRLRDGGTTYLIGTRTMTGPTLLIGHRLR